MLLKRIYDDMWAAKKAGDANRNKILNTLYAEAAKKGKDDRNGESTDAEVMQVIKKFVDNLNEFIAIRQKRGEDYAELAFEKDLLMGYMPKQLSADELAVKINEFIVTNNVEKTPKSMGTVMAFLKKNFEGQYDGKLASEKVKAALA